MAIFKIMLLLCPTYILSTSAFTGNNGQLSHIAHKSVTENLNLIHKNSYAGYGIKRYPSRLALASITEEPKVDTESPPCTSEGISRSEMVTEEEITPQASDFMSMQVFLFVMVSIAFAVAVASAQLPTSADDLGGLVLPESSAGRRLGGVMDWLGEVRVHGKTEVGGFVLPESSVGRWLGGVLDWLGEVRVDGKTEDEYWVFPFLGSLRILRKKSNIAEIAVGGFAAGTVVELALALISYPFNTIETRQQANPKEGRKKLPTLARLYDGFGPVALTVPALSVFWATKDVVRTRIFAAVTQVSAPVPLVDTLATGFAALVGEAILWLIKSPSAVLATQKQVALLREDQDPTTTAHSLENISVKLNKLELLSEAVKAWPVLAIADVPYVSIRVAVFVALHDSGIVPSGMAADEFFFLIANLFAVMLTTPIYVIRTQMLLGRKPIQELPNTVKDLYRNDGILAFQAGWSARLLYNGLFIGLTLGLLRQFYDCIRDYFFLDILDNVELVVRNVQL